MDSFLIGMVITGFGFYSLTLQGHFDQQFLDPGSKKLKMMGLRQPWKLLSASGLIGPNTIAK